MENTYQFNQKRLLSLVELPIVYTAFIALLIYPDYRQRSHIDFKKLIGFALLLLFVWAGLIFLLLNHWPFARKTSLVIERQVLKLNVNGTDHSIPFADIKEIVVHTAGRLPWSAIVK
jgi:hypothetical protein